MNSLVQSSLIVLFCSCSFMMNATSAKDIFVGQRVAGQTPLEAVDHSDWDRMLQKYVDQNGQVNYTAWRQSRADQAALAQYLNRLSLGKPAGSSKAGQLAFWINAYNAVTVRGILDVYPTTSIRNHTAKLVGYNIWKNLYLFVDGQKHSLDSIEHKILRKMNEPRIHFAIVCASIGCPRLMNNAYLPATIDRQLHINAVDFFSRPQNLQFQSASNTLQLSSLLSWFQSDFGADQGAMLRNIQQWITDPNAKQAAASGRAPVQFLDYDWNLNDQKSIRR
ncbi:MAG: DUF547 domain-containing protein [Fuerstiella sp.]